MRYTYKIFFAIWVFSMGSLLFSQNYQEVQKLQSEYKKVLERQALQKPIEISEAEKIASSTALPDKLVYSRKLPKGSWIRKTRNYYIKYNLLFGELKNNKGKYKYQVIEIKNFKNITVNNGEFFYL